MLIIPIGDDNPSARIPYVTYGIVAVNLAVFFIANGIGQLPPDVSREWGFVANSPEWYTFVTSTFLHGGLLHIVFNMLFLWIFGDNVEDKLGHVLYLVFYLAAGALACAFYMLFTGFSGGSIPLVGASGAIAGVMGCYMLFFPEARIRYFYWVFWFFVGIIPIRAKWSLGIWIAMNLVNWLVFKSQYVTGVAYAAHVGGFAVGVGAAALAKGWLVRQGRVAPHDEGTGFVPRGTGTPPVRPKPDRLKVVRPEPEDFQRARPEPSTSKYERDFVSPRIQTERDHEGFFGIEEAIAENLRTAQSDVALEKYRDYVRMRHAKALPSWAQIEIAAELFKLKDYDGALEAYRRYLAHYPNGPDAGEAKFRLGIILSRYRKEYFRAREYLLQAVVEHPDREIVSFAREELDRISAQL